MKFVSEAYRGGVGGGGGVIHEYGFNIRMEQLDVSYHVYLLEHSLHLLFSDLLSVCHRPHKD